MRETVLKSRLKEFEANILVAKTLKIERQLKAAGGNGNYDNVFKRENERLRVFRNEERRWEVVAVFNAENEARLIRFEQI